MKNLYGSDIFHYKPSLWFVMPIFMTINTVTYLFNSNENLGMAAQNRPDILPGDSNYHNYLLLAVFLASIAAALWFWHLYFKTSRFIKLTDEAISAPKHFASRQMIEIKFSDVISIKESSWNGNLIIEHKHGKLTLDNTGFKDKQIRYNVFHDIQKRYKAYIQSMEIK